MTSDSTILQSIAMDTLRDLTVETDGETKRFRAEFFLDPRLVGPPGRLHGGFHPLVRTLPVLRELLPDADLERVSIDASLLKGLKLEEAFTLEGTLRGGADDFVLDTRVGEGDRLHARATPVTGGSLNEGLDLASLKTRYEATLALGLTPSAIIGAHYLIAPELVIFDFADASAENPDAHVSRCRDARGRRGIAALSTQLDAVGATARGALMRSPHFTTHFHVSFDIGAMTADERPIVIADRAAVEELPDSGIPAVELKGTFYGSARAPAYAISRDFSRVWARAWVSVHPVDPKRFAGFEKMRKLRQDVAPS